MSDNPQICSSNTEGLILSSFEVLQDSLSQGNLRQMKLKNAYSTGIDDRLSSRSSQYKQSCLPDDSHPPHMSTHPCVTETNEGDEMFDVTDQFRADEAGDSLDNDTNNNSLDRDDEGDDEEEEDEEEDEVHNVVRQNDGQRLVSTAQDLTSSVETSQQETAPSNLRVHHHPKEAYTSHGSNLPAHNFINSSRALWHSGPTTPNNTARYSGDWHLPLNTSAGERRRTDVFSGSSSPDESRDRGCEEQHWKFVHGQTEEQHAHWVPDHGQGKVVVGPVSSNWVGGSKRERVQDQTHDLHAIHGHSSMDRSSHWNQHIRTAQADIHTWPKGSVYAPDSEMNNVRSLFTVQPSQSVLATPSASTSYTDIDPARTGSWNLNTHIPAAQSLGNLPRPLLAHEMSCRRASTSGIYQQTPSQSFTGFPGQARADWSASALSPGPSGLTTELPSEHYKLGGVERGPVCKSSIISKRGKGRGIRGESTVEGHPPTTHRPALDQVRQQAHPYQIKDQKKVVRDVYPATSANVHTLKASHIVSWYIDYLIHENEHLTQISRAFSLPVNLFHSDDFYFMDSLKKKVHFPSLKFLSWMQQNLPSINVNAIDFHEGRPPVISTWNQDWFWQNKSRRDIIHDVFFYFQHRRVTCDN